MGHAILAPSSAPIWGNCAGSVKAQQGRPNPETPQSREGTAAHWVMAEVLLNFTGRQSGPLICDEYIGRTAPNGVVIDGKMAQGAQVIVDDVLKVCQQHGGLQSLLVEKRVTMPRVHPENWGTLDVSLYLPAIGWLFVWDYKHGHRPVEAEANEQLIDYVAGLVELHGIDGLADQQTTVCIRIVQPFAYRHQGPIDEWVVRLSDLRGPFNLLSARAYEALGPSPTMSAGPWCRDCLAVRDCAVGRKYVYSLIDTVNAPYELDSMTSADMAAERLILREGAAVLKARLEAIEEDLHYRITQGDTASGLTVETAPGKLEYTVPDAQAQAFALQFGVDISKPGVMTPIQSIAKAPKEIRPIFEQAIKAITRRPAGALNLIPAKNSRTMRAFLPRK